MQTTKRPGDWVETAPGLFDLDFDRYGMRSSTDLVLLELEERARGGAVNSLSVSEFDGAGRIRHLDVYLQMARPAA